MGNISQKKYEEVWNKISLKSDCISPDAVKKMYFGLLRAISADLRETGRCWLPHLGEFRLIRRTPRLIPHVKRGEVYRMEDVRVIKFKPDYKLKAYFKNMKTAPVYNRDRDQKGRTDLGDNGIDNGIEMKNMNKFV